MGSFQGCDLLGYFFLDLALEFGNAKPKKGNIDPHSSLHS